MKITTTQCQIEPTQDRIGWTGANVYPILHNMAVSMELFGNWVLAEHVRSKRLCLVGLPSQNWIADLEGDGYRLISNLNNWSEAKPG